MTHSWSFMVIRVKNMNQGLFFQHIIITNNHEFLINFHFITTPFLPLGGGQEGGVLNHDLELPVPPLSGEARRGLLFHDLELSARARSRSEELEQARLFSHLITTFFPLWIYTPGAVGLLSPSFRPCSVYHAPSVVRCLLSVVNVKPVVSPSPKYRTAFCTSPSISK